MAPLVASHPSFNRTTGSLTVVADDNAANFAEKLAINAHLESPNARGGRRRRLCADFARQTGVFGRRQPVDVLRPNEKPIGVLSSADYTSKSCWKNRRWRARASHPQFALAFRSPSSADVNGDRIRAH